MFCLIMCNVKNNNTFLLNVSYFLFRGFSRDKKWDIISADFARKESGLYTGKHKRIWFIFKA